MATTLPNTGAIIPEMTEAPDQAVNNAAFTAIDAAIGFRGVVLGLNAAKPISNATPAFINWDMAVAITSSNFFEISTPNLIKVPAGIKAVRLGVSVEFQPAASGRKFIEIQQNSVACARTDLPNITGTATVLSCITPPIMISGASNFQVRVYQDSGEAIDINANEKTRFYMEILG